MRAVALLTIFLLAILIQCIPADNVTVRAPTDQPVHIYEEIMSTFNKCMTGANNVLPEFNHMTSSDVGPYCSLMRFDALRCLADKLGISENGTSDSRGAVLLETIRMGGRHPTVLQTTRLYHYACIHQDWAMWLTESCFKLMFTSCIHKDAECDLSSCDIVSPPEAVSENKNGTKNGVVLPNGAIALMILVLVNED